MMEKIILWIEKIVLGEQEPFWDEFETKYGNNSLLFYRGSYSEAMSYAWKVGKPLVIFLHSPVHDDSDLFCKEVLLNPTIIAALNERFILWGGNVQSPVGYKAYETLQCTAFPFLCIMSKEQEAIQVIRLEGCLEPADIIQQFDLI